jgi:three-Cys-motif partner protein
MLDEIGPWSEIKLEIIKKYASAYSTILNKQKGFYYIYIDAFAGAGIHISRKTKELVLGSPIKALSVKPPFKEYHFIDLDKIKVKTLEEISGKQDNVKIYEGDCNTILLEKVFPQVRYEDYYRALCLLDPYGLHLNWEVIEIAGKMRSIEIFLNFPIADMNRNVLRKKPSQIDLKQKERLNKYWGDESWIDITYYDVLDLFGRDREKVPNERIAEGFRNRLIKAAGFKYVPKPLPMRNTKGAIVYYLFFAAHKPVSEKIVLDIFKKYEKFGVK